MGFFFLCVCVLHFMPYTATEELMLQLETFKTSSWGGTFDTNYYNIWFNKVSRSTLDFQYRLQDKSPLIFSGSFMSSLHHNTGNAAESLLTYEKGFQVMVNGTKCKMSRRRKVGEMLYLKRQLQGSTPHSGAYCKCQCAPAHYFSYPREQALKLLAAFSIRRKSFVIEACYLLHMPRPTDVELICFYRFPPAQLSRLVSTLQTRLAECEFWWTLWTVSFHGLPVAHYFKKKSHLSPVCHPLLCSQSSCSGCCPPTDHPLQS